MTTSAVYSVDKKKPADATENTHEPIQSVRETVESIVVAFILAFLFRAFVAEAFVIPTGSMAPTLMGAHKDVVCEHCGKQYQSSASNEFDSNSGALTSRLVVASTCPTCRGLNAFDLKNNANHATFSGDRILVSKFDYVLHNPQRWDVIVFKYPKNARMNYIKRLVGLPGETLRIRGGDVYVRPSDSEVWTIARKPPHKIHAMRQIVADTKFQPKELVAVGWPSLWQPAPLEQTVEPKWQVNQAENQWSAELAASDATQWLRYYHKFLTSTEWETFASTQQLPSLEPLSSRLITDYQAYNTSYTTSRNAVYDSRGKMLAGGDGKGRPYFDLDPSQIWSDSSGQSHSMAPPLNDSEHWVGDLAGEFSVDVISPSGTLSLLLVEHGVEFRCDIDIASGKAKLQAFDGDRPLPIFGDANTTSSSTSGSGAADALTADTALRGAGKYHLEFANFDDQIVLWVDGKVVEFSSPAHFSFASIRQVGERRPYWRSDNPLDAAPVAIGGQGLALKVERAQIWRDIYYIAINGSNYTDFTSDRTEDFIAAVPDQDTRNAIVGQYMERSQAAIQAVYANPEWWSKTKLFDMRGEREYALADDHYFPMGDNSAQSLDARAWHDHNYVEQRFMLGKALLVFWPHYWNRPIPFFPNFSRMGLIR